MTPYRPPRRDKVAWGLANAALRLATPKYRRFVQQVITDGLIVNGLRDQDRQK